MSPIPCLFSTEMQMLIQHLICVRDPFKGFTSVLLKTGPVDDWHSVNYSPPVCDETSREMKVSIEIYSNLTLLHHLLNLIIKFLLIFQLIFPSEKCSYQKWSCTIVWAALYMLYLIHFSRLCHKLLLVCPLYRWRIEHWAN